METPLILLSFLVLLLIIAIVILVILLTKKSVRHDDSAIIINQQLEGLRSQLTSIIEGVNKQMESSTAAMISSQKMIGERLEGATKVVAEVSRSLGSLEQATTRIFEVGKDIASLQEILRSPKLRGGLGEFLLGDLLSQILPSEHFELQYKFKSGETVDAIVRLGDKIVPVDSKFPLENFKKMCVATDETAKKEFRKKFVSDVKKHIDTIKSKYILPEEGTFDFALMYIPAENVYYETIIKDDQSDEKNISSYALSQRVIPTSPNSFYVYLQSILLGLRGLKIDRDAKLVLQHLEQLKGDFEKFSEDFEMLGRHIANTKGKYDETSKKAQRLGEKIISLERSENKFPN